MIFDVVLLVFSVNSIVLFEVVLDTFALVAGRVVLFFGEIFFSSIFLGKTFFSSIILGKTFFSSDFLCKICFSSILSFFCTFF